MNSETLTKEIYDKYTKVWEQLIKKYQNLCVSMDYLSLRYMFEKTKIYYYVQHINGYETIPIPFNMLYGLLEDFFMDNGIDIFIDIQRIIFDPDKKAIFMFTIANDLELIYEDYGIKSKNKAEFNAILKACKILEEKLEER